jgi:hypothetical protein
MAAMADALLSHGCIVPANTSSMPLIPTTLVIGASASVREAAIAAALAAQRPQHTALILEGLPDGTSVLAETEAQDGSEDALTITRIAPGCICCSGNLPMRVSLNRILRTRPERLFISLANSAHLPQIRAFLLQEPYDKWLSLTNEIVANSTSGQHPC